MATYVWYVATHVVMHCMSGFYLIFSAYQDYIDVCDEKGYGTETVEPAEMIRGDLR